MVSACTPNLPRAPVNPGGEHTVGGEAQVGMADDPPQGQQIFPGDVITVRLIAEETEEFEGLVVDETGVLHVPLAGDVQIANMSLADAETRVEEALRQYDTASRVSLVIDEALGHQATVVGAVMESGRIPVTPGMRLADLLAAAGGASRGEQDGLTISAGDLGSARLIRGGVMLPVSLELALNGDARHNVHVRPGDTLYVPADYSRLVSVMGEVDDSRVLAHRPNLRLTQALALAGGVTRDGNWNDVRIIRGDPARPTVYSTSVSDIVDGRAPDVYLAPGDVIVVASAGHADLRDVMNSFMPMLTIPLTAASILTLALQN